MMYTKIQNVFISILVGGGVLIVIFFVGNFLFWGLFEDILIPIFNRDCQPCTQFLWIWSNFVGLIAIIAGIVAGRKIYKHQTGESHISISRVRDLSIGFFGWWLICWLGYLVSLELGRGGVSKVFDLSVVNGYVYSQNPSVGLIWDYVFPMVTAIAIGVLFYKRRNWFAYGILVAIIINTLLMASFFGADFSLTGIRFEFSPWVDSPLSFPAPLYLFMGY